MKSKYRFILCQTCTTIALIGGFVASSHANRISNGSFEVEPVGTTVVVSGATVDDSTFTGWRFVSIGTTPADFSATSVTNASD